MRLIPTLFALLLIGPLWAAVPTSLNYQAYLTDRDGSPQSGNTLMTFSLYAVEVGGSPLWFDTLNIDIENGLLGVELGRPANPFPLDLFETPLWLGIAVEADGEMIPRRALTSVGFSFKSEDANSVQGKSAADLDQSAHTDDLANPHAVTAAQAGAADQAILDSHTGDTANPHLTTAAQTGGTDAGVFSSHAANESAHHSRYSDAESVAAVLASDGPGSGLDSDTVDGVDGAALQANVVTNTSDIADVAATSQANTDAISLFNSGLVVKANGQAIANFGFVSGGTTVFAVTHTGYMFGIGIGGDGRIDETDLRYEQPDCEGPPSMASGNNFHDTQGEVRRVADNLFYLPPGAPPFTFVVVSRFSSAGCLNYPPDSSTGYAPIPNDPVVTGVPNSDFTPPITLGN